MAGPPARLSLVTAPHAPQDPGLLDLRSLGYAEDFCPTSEAVAEARRQALMLGAPSLSNGAAAALTFLARLINAGAVVEIGTGIGVSGLALLDGMAPDGVLTSIGSEADWQLEARRAFQATGVPSRRLRLITGAALDVLNNLRDGAYDLVFINGDKLEYVEYLAQAARLLRHGGLAVLNDALWHNLVADPRNEDDETVIIREALSFALETEDFEPLLVPLGDGLLIALRN